MRQYETLSKENWAYFSTLKMDEIPLNRQQVKEIILHCKKLEHLSISVMCTLKTDYYLDFAKLELLKIMLLKIYIKGFQRQLAIEGSPALITSKVRIFSPNCKTFKTSPDKKETTFSETLETSPDKHENAITLNFRKCSNLKS
jgi:hypothetical protein